MRRLLLVAALCSAACGGSSPAGPDPVTQPATVTVSGRVTTTLTGEPVAGAALSFSGRIITAGADGRWTLDGQARNATVPVELTAGGYLTRQTAVRTADGRSDITIDLIRNSGGFALSFFRELARNGLEQPGQLRELRRWTVNPNFYVHAQNPRTGARLEDSEIALIEGAIRAAVAQMTGDTLQAGSITFGDAPAVETSGSISLSFIYDPNASYCGQALVGVNPGRITINYDRCASACGSLKVTPETIAHEVGHAMGFWHASGGGILDTSRTRRCGNTSFSTAETHHARVAYSRQPGNMDVDRDSSSFSLLAAPGSPPPLVQCFR